MRSPIILELTQVFPYGRVGGQKQSNGKHLRNRIQSFENLRCRN